MSTPASLLMRPEEATRPHRWPRTRLGGRTARPYEKIEHMGLLVVGGTRFVGRVLVEQALLRGHTVTTFNQGRTGGDVLGVEAVHGDREKPGDIRRLVDGRSWGVVVDTSGYVPEVVLSNARELVNHVNWYVFLSTVSVYPDWPQQGVSEDSPVHDCPPEVGGSAEDEANWSAAQYGAYKAGCERAARRVFADHALVLRPSVILGPGENVGRLRWWLTRAAHGGRMLAPGDPERSMQPIDVRDIAAFTFDCLDNGTVGTFNVAASREHTTYRAFLASCIAVTGSDAELVWVDDDFLLAHGVKQRTELPLWRTYAGTWNMTTEKAQEFGLTCRSIEETIRDTCAWLEEKNDPASYARQSHHGLDPSKEDELLRLWEEIQA